MKKVIDWHIQNDNTTKQTIALFFASFFSKKKQNTRPGMAWHGISIHPPTD